MNKPFIKIDQSRCIGCGLCAKVCVTKIIKIQDNKAKVKLDGCIQCSHCSAICPTNAISIPSIKEKAIEKKQNVRLDPNQVLDTIRFRRSIRHFESRKVEPEIIQQILEAGRLTHTAKNSQDVSFIVVEKQRGVVEKQAVALFKKLKPIVDLASKSAKGASIKDDFFFFQAPLVIVILANNKTNGILASQNMEFVAEAYGLGVLYSGFFTIAANLSSSIKKTLGIPKKKRVAMTLVLGYPSIQYKRTTVHKPLDVTYR